MIGLTWRCSFSKPYGGAAGNNKLELCKMFLQCYFKRMDDESFCTLMKDVQNFVNLIPLNVNNTMSLGAPELLMPNHLLTMKVTTLMPPPGVLLREDLYSNERWHPPSLLIELERSWTAPNPTNGTWCTGQLNPTDNGSRGLPVSSSISGSR